MTKEKTAHIGYDCYILASDQIELANPGCSVVEPTLSTGTFQVNSFKSFDGTDMIYVMCRGRTQRINSLVNFREFFRKQRINYANFLWLKVENFLYFFSTFSLLFSNFLYFSLLFSTFSLLFSTFLYFYSKLFFPRYGPLFVGKVSVNEKQRHFSMIGKKIQVL